MIWEDIRIEDIDADQWANFFSLFARAERDDPRDAASGASRRRVLVIHRGGTVLRIVPAGEGIERHGLAPLADLSEIRRRVGARQVIALEVDALRRIMARAQRGFDHDADFVDQLLIWYEALRAEMGDGIRLDPPAGRLSSVNVALARRLFRFFFTRPQVLAFYVMDGAAVHSSIILGLRDGMVTRLTTHEALEARGFEMQWGLPDAPRIVAELSRRYAPVRLGVFLDVATWDRCWRRGTERWREAIAAGEIVFEPAPLPVEFVVFLLKTLRSLAGRN